MIRGKGGGGLATRAKSWDGVKGSNVSDEMGRVAIAGPGLGAQKLSGNKLTDSFIAYNDFGNFE